ncbi:cation-translocating P-type ATPase [Clostridium tepidum]|uniref:P-type Ca(2+) transporter n=1 Tax=Clostridium tepidum TaxID=1962263 RepID=A0A1S9I576_9CLOT|nr:cation-translocating P-type ATPase [Clostridium tepidum]MCR1933176.1 cation-translocating P-type ATPase [Clostridium tepidum]MDU6877338.1 cation-translocating P-type ATPase [Clostridium botulinum]OOO62768.1 ATPase [Clostridium tepidum]OOO65449.1 ATPase [Clostridium tepidum]
MEKYFQKSIEETMKYFNVTKKGLNSKEVKRQRDQYGYNELVEKKKNTILSVFLEQFKDFLVIILIIAGIISMVTGNIESTIVIFAVITLNAILGTVQHIKAENSLNSLKKLSSPHAKVIRDGKKIELLSKEIVPGDILILEAGDYVPADGRIIENYSIQVNESSLTGESESVLKSVDIISENDIALGDQKNMIFSGSFVTYGRATVVVTNTGMNTEIGKIASLIEDTQEKETPLQVSLDDFGKKLAMIILIISALIFLLDIYRGSSVLNSLMFAVALAVAAIPEALSSIVTIVLAIGTQKMASENAIIKKLKAVEGLGSVSVICSDKTGTLTQNKMKTEKIYTDNKIFESNEFDLKNSVQNLLIKASILCNDATVQQDKKIGDPTEIAFVELGKNYSLDELKLRKTYPRLSEIPFDSNRKLMSTSHKFDGQYLMITKGAVDVLLKRIKYIKTSEGIKEFTDENKKKVESVNYEFSQNGLRVLAFAYKEIKEDVELSMEDEDNYIFLGLISMVDPPRKESYTAVKQCIQAGIKPVMITGDHKITASSIASQIGILRTNDEAIEGVELDKISDEELKDRVENISVYARVSPEHKIRIVKAWQEKGKIVAMTGDGVNDAPALKQADIGIAMGITGTEVSKNAASMILTDDNFATIVKSISNGRSIYSNIKNAIRFLLSGNTAGILSVLYASLFALPVPFAPVHLLFINLLTDSLPAIAIGVEQTKNDLINEKPRNINEPILSKNFLKGILNEGILITIFTMVAFHIGLKGYGENLAATMAFATLCLSRLFHGFNCRSNSSIFKIGLFSNKYTWIAFSTGFFLLNLVLAFDPLKELFQVSPLNIEHYIYIYILAALPTIIIQAYRFIFKEKFNLTHSLAKGI